MYYCIVRTLLLIYPTITHRCVSFVLFPPVSLSELPTYFLYPWQGFVSLHVRSPYPLFNSPRFCVHSPCLFLGTSAYQKLYSLTKNLFHFIVIPSHHIPFLPSLKISRKRSELPSSQMYNPTT